MSATSRALAALTLAAAMLLPAPAVSGLPSQATPHAGAQAFAVPRTEATVSPDAGATELPRVATKGWVLADLDSGEILAMNNPELPLRPASTLKLLTALTVAHRLDPAQPYLAVADDETAEGNRVVLYEGLRYTVADLLHAALLPSANDAAQALARANGGVESTVEQMNAEAARLGARNTTAKNPSGLDEDGQFTTALDLAVIGRAALADPEIGAYLKLRTADFPGKATAQGRVIYPIYNQNRLIINNFDGALGGKSGYTTKARRTFVGAAERDGRRLLVSLLDIGGNTYTTAQVLLDWAFANAEDLNAVGQLPEPTAPAAEYDRTITPLPTLAEPASRAGGADGTATSQTSDSGAPIAADTGGGGFGVPSPLTVLTLLAAILVALRARVYWAGYRGRTAPSGLPTVPEPRPTGLAGSSAPTRSDESSSTPHGPIDLRSGAPRRGATSNDQSLVGTRR